MRPLASINPITQMESRYLQRSKRQRKKIRQWAIRLFCSTGECVLTVTELSPIHYTEERVDGNSGKDGERASERMQEN